MATYNIRAGVLFVNGSLKLSACLQKDGAVLASAANATAALYNTDGTLVNSFSTVASPDSQGVFTFSPLTVSLGNPLMYYLRLTIADGGTTCSDVIFPKNI